MISFVALVLAGGLSVVGIVKFSDSLNKNVLPSVGSYKFQASLDTIPSSNLEWISKQALIPKAILKKMIQTTSVTGKITEIKLATGKLSGLKEYYTGEEKGYHAYEGYIRLRPLQDGKVVTIYFSPKSMSIMRLVDDSGKTMRFGDLTVEDAIEIEESVDLAVSNIDDENVLSLIIKKVN